MVTVDADMDCLYLLTALRIPHCQCHPTACTRIRYDACHYYLIMQPVTWLADDLNARHLVTTYDDFPHLLLLRHTTARYDYSAVTTHHTDRGPTITT